MQQPAMAASPPTTVARYIELEAEETPLGSSAGTPGGRGGHGAAKAKAMSDWALGIVFIVSVSLIWAASSVIVQFVYDDSDFHSPMGLTYICNSMFALYLPGYLALCRLGLARNPPLREPKPSPDAPPHQQLTPHQHQRQRNASSCSAVGREERGCGGTDGAHAEPCPALAQASTTSAQQQQEEAASFFDDADGSPPPPQLRSHWSTAKAALYICPVWFAATLTYNASLRITSVTSSTIISCTSALWTLLFSLLCARERLTAAKALGVLLAVGGGALVGLADDRGTGADPSQQRGTVLGDVLAVLSAVLYGVYSTLLAVHVPRDDECAMPLLFGYLGAFSAVACAPLLLAASRPFAGLSWRTLSTILGNGIFDNLLADLLWGRAVLLTTPTVASVGLALTIPFAFVTDFVFHGMVPSPLELFGAALVVSGFLVVSARGHGGK